MNLFVLFMSLTLISCNGGSGEGGNALKPKVASGDVITPTNNPAKNTATIAAEAFFKESNSQIAESHRLNSADLEILKENEFATDAEILEIAQLIKE